MNTITTLSVPDFTRLDDVGENLIPLLNALREKEPVVWNESVQAWMLLRYEDVLAGYEGKLPLSNRAIAPDKLEALIPREEQQQRIPNIVSHVPKWVVNSDPPDHTRIRNLMLRGFKPRNIEAIRPAVQKIVADMLAKMEEKAECDLVEEVREVTMRTIMHFIGIPAEEFDRAKFLSDEITDSFTRPYFSAQTLERTDAALEESRKIFVREIARRREHPSDDFLSQMVALVDESGNVSEEELVAQLLLMLPAGHDSTTNTIVFGFVALLRNPEIRERFLQSPEILSQNVAELMRYVAMSSVSNRVATQDFELHGKQIKRGDMVLLVIASANRDPRCYDNPEAFDPAANSKTSFVFGNGMHHCLGHLLAKMEITELLPALMRRFPNAVIEDEKLAYSSALSFRGLDSLRVRLHKAE